MKLSKLIAIVLHHSVTRQTPEEQTWEQIKNQGIEKHGYPDYHFGVGASGKIYQGCPIDTVSAHCGIDINDKPQHSSKVNNWNSLAICAIGNFEEQAMGEPQILGIVQCIQNIRKQYPGLFLMLHKELIATACPGRLYPYQKIFALLKGETAANTSPFKDVETKRWSYPAIRKVYDLGIMKGDEFGFRPNDPITREEAAQMIANTLKYLGK